MSGMLKTAGDGVFQVPYSEDFEKEETFDGFTVHDVNKDNATFRYNSSWKGNFAVCEYGFTEPKDDWLITPGIHLEQGRTYRLSFLLWTKGNLSETVEVKIGRGTEVADMTVSVMNPTEISQPGTVDLKQTLEFYISVEEAGTWHVGFHAMTPGDPMDAFDVIIDDIAIEEAAVFSAPAAVENLTAVAGEQGALEAEVSFTTPSVNIEGGTLDALEKAEIYCNGELTATIPEPGIGVQVKHTVPTLQGDNEIMAKVYGTGGAGLEAKTTVYTGVVRPQAPGNVKARLDGDAIVLTWDAPESGVDGGYIDPGKLTYMVMRSDWTYVDEYATGNTITDNDISSFTTKPQAIVSYVVYAENVAGLGTGTMSNGVVVGDGTYELPFADSFPNGFPSTDVWGIMSTTETSWFSTTKTSTITPSDNDNGMIFFSPMGEDESSTIYTGRFCLNGTVNPTLRFSYWYDAATPTGNKVNVQVTRDYETFTTFATLDFATVDAHQGWNEFSVPLTDFINEPMVALGFEGVSGTEGSKVELFLDNIRVSDYLDHNLRFNLFSAPGCIRIGESGLFSASVENIGNKAAMDYTVDLLCNGEKVAGLPGLTVLPGEYEVYSFNVSPYATETSDAEYHAVISYSNDQNTNDNATDGADVTIIVPDYPRATGLSAHNTDNGVALTWQAPEEAVTKTVTNEDFESYDPFIIDGIGDWKMYDGDGSTTLVVSFGGSPVEYLNAGNPMAWQVWNADMAGLGYESTGSTAFCPNSGSQCLASFDAASGQSDDWLISPELSGDAQLVTFFVKTSVPNYGLQEYEFLWSEGSTEPADFNVVEGSSREAFWDWQEMCVTLPDGARRFAIRNKSQYKLALLVDDIRYTRHDAAEEPLSVSGYNIYRDGVKLNTEPVTTTEYTDVTDNAHRYTVTVVYRQGESGPSDIAEPDENGIGTVEAADTAAVHAGYGHIDVLNATGKPVTVTRADGVTVWRGTPSSAHVSVALPSGLYVASVGHDVYKVIVK